MNLKPGLVLSNVIKEVKTRPQSDPHVTLSVHQRPVMKLLLQFETLIPNCLPLELHQHRSLMLLLTASYLLFSLTVTWNLEMTTPPPFYYVNLKSFLSSFSLIMVMLVHTWETPRGCILQTVLMTAASLRLTFVVLSCIYPVSTIGRTDMKFGKDNL